MITINTRIRILQAFAGIFAAIAVLLSAWLSHAGKELPLVSQNNIETALLFAFIHVLAIFIVVIAYNQSQRAVLVNCGYLFLFGIIAFSGVLILKVFVAVGALSKLTPIGGMAFVLGWLILAFVQLKE
ncbi:DUF423 domain-containing protein [Thalassomonas sp. M1454]|uniref:DUF423 domain-containing protein n=1 Tax=Thalassomonas sp. M1454 TaxID=2594477 RepID=UPI00117C06DE|nr:DUF423 domain-containing protein [Thalassomonas sp. M1454]TRX57075.1 DUF423 domain-containing protein [Thalassomonas sp. M1454]